MTNKSNPNILYLNNDLRNNIGAAISHIQLLTMEYPELTEKGTTYRSLCPYENV